MRADIVTIFPAYLEPLRLSLVGRAVDRGTLDLHPHDLRAWTSDVHRTVDDAPYGGGPGMVMRPEPWDAALTEIRAVDPDRRPRIIVPTPAGTPFSQRYAEELAREPWLVFCCGRYEGIDSRVVDTWADDEISIGDYVLAGGEVATLVILEAVARLLPGVLGNSASHQDDSFSDGLLEGPVYTRPPTWRGLDVPPVLRSGDHGAIARWRRAEALRRTARRRPDLLDRLPLSDADRAVVAAERPGPLEAAHVAEASHAAATTDAIEATHAIEAAHAIDAASATAASEAVEATHAVEDTCAVAGSEVVGASETGEAVRESPGSGAAGASDASP